MPRPDLSRRLAALGGFVAACAATPALATPDRPTQPLRHEAPIRIERAATFVQLVLPPAVYARSEQGLADLRVVDAKGERVPFTLLAPRRTLETREAARPAELYPLPAASTSARSAAVAPASPVDVVVDGDRITVRRRPPGATPAGSGPSPGWLIDTGERAADRPPVRAVRVRWSGPAEFSAGYRLETSDDLKRWRGGAVGQLIALQSPGGPLVQPNVELAEGAGRFVRLVWFDPASAPVVVAASAIAPEQRRVDVDAAIELGFAASADAKEPRALVFDLGAVLPLDDVALRFASGTRIMPALIEGRRRADEPWRALGATVFNRFERAGDGTPAVGESPPYPLEATVRFVRLLVDERAARPRAEEARLVVRVRPDVLVFAGEGVAPYRLLAGSVDAPAGALPPATLVARLDDERPRFGAASLGEFREIEAAALAIESEARTARLRPIVLWAVLLIGVAGLGAMVWRLARSGAPAAVAPPADVPPA